MAISKTTLFSEAYHAMYHLLQDYLTSTSTIYSSYPEGIDILSKDDLPIIIVNPCRPVIEGLTFGGKRKITYAIDIDIANKSLDTLDTLSDEIIAVFDANQSYLKTNGLYLGKVPSIGEPTTEISPDSKIIIRTRRITFEFIHIYAR